MSGAPTVTCIVPAYNEAARIGAVLTVATAHPALTEVIVVDDGSQDGTAEVAAATPGVRLIRMERNGGKTRAVARGVAEARGRFLLLLDSDLQGLTLAALSALLAPVLAGQAQAAISLRGNAPWPWRALGVDYISGERVIPRDLLAGQEQALTALPKFGLEVHMNRQILAQRLDVAIVPWPGVRSPLKSEKQGLLPGLRADARMLADIFRTIPLHEAARQIHQLRRARV
jgi:glycosyltransferase involved in cell wall biosynthesis